ncbi:GNAT family N-acetyltransferase [Chloroflexia bacterium SDU3-3]|nr:GNAT family N-acetyltransferase [Chloroflexia bacterium SDU3-3]
MTHDIRPISPAEARPLRQQVLRPLRRAEELVYPCDSDPEGVHFGAFHQGTLVGIVSLSPAPCPLHGGAGTWQLRGMATLPEVRRMGYGAALVRAGIRHVASRGGEQIWCNARVGAMPFYQSLGFVAQGEEFPLPEAGPHYVMLRDIQPGE